ncbi:MAG: hypothetical protein Q8R08_01170 [bacterium]|nr:hypothetical protein [bacterium]
MTLPLNKINALALVLIVVILAAVFWSSLGSARATARDAKRVKDVQYIQEALKLYYNDNLGYPDVLMSGQEAKPDSSPCADRRTQFSCYMPEYPRYPRPIDGAECANYEHYTYAKLPLSEGGYRITFCLAASAEGFPAGPHAGSANGIR